MLLIETSLLFFALCLAFVHPKFGSLWFSKLEHSFSSLAHRRRLAVFIVGLSALTVRLAVLPIEPIPEPIVHDEFGYLLAADTFAHGRLTNPTPPMWPHFETFSILIKPTYQCYGQPGQGMLLAIGKVLFGHPFWGVWLSCGFMSAAITWMLQGWLAPEWALLGGFLAIARYGVFGYWANSYWGGALAAIGGALVMGALPRIKNRKDLSKLRYSFLMGLGLAILANTRPYEGVVFSLPVAFALFAWILTKGHPPFSMSFRQIILPITLVLSLCTIWLGCYFWRVTGSPFKIPYQLEREAYAMTPYMLWGHPRPEPQYQNAVIQKMYEEDLSGFQHSRYWIELAARAVASWDFFLGPLLSLPFVLLVFALPRDFSLRRISSPALFLLFAIGFFIAGLAAETYYGPHYAAPATSLLLALVLLALAQVRKSGNVGLLISRLIPVVCLLSLLILAFATPLHIPLHENYEFAWFQRGAPSFGRGAIERKLQKLPGDHLVLVRYNPEHRPFEEWVYNDADVEHAKIVWAREVSTTDDKQLLEHFRSRKLWLLEADLKPPRLSSIGVNDSGLLYLRPHRTE